MSAEKLIRNVQSAGDDSQNEKKDCVSCRVVGGLGCIGIGFYVAAQASKSTGFVNRSGLMLFAAGFAFLGGLRLASIDLATVNQMRNSAKK